MALLLLIVPGLSASATTVDVGGSGTSDCTFWCTARLQQVYSSSLFSGLVTIDRVSFYASPGNGTAWNGISSWEMSLSTSVNPVGALDSTFDNNVGADEAVFDTQTFSGTPLVGSLVSFLGSFNYDPTMGDLLIDIQRVSGPAMGTGLDAGQDAGNIDRAYAFSSVSVADGVNQNGYALRTQFGLHVPEPSSLILMGLAATGLSIATRRHRRARSIR